MYSTSAAKNSDTSKPLTVTKVLEFYRRPEGVEIVAVVKQRDEIIQADKLAGETKRIDAL